MLFARAAPRTKSKGLPIDVPCRLILFIRAAKTYLNCCIIVLFIHINHRRMKSKGHLYIYIIQ
jgi:hypothetical protein